eukprot:CAMPEP_0181201402 /NCGR_PEP_ID=MMETSP1096-20121128/18288_1 /TAXON_ID=156174 ORGANISM="Chrysochromulina ericina, Strain CCMP281" /NCGR_SAMPLE_ID=MMETSP1096 /ASSEMBLY_ACC=CAM_ASM_000453 /LENGTH=59 /DNA_ID=CAMNT_0023291843 /DNA_START=564 /DNA_END=743 /DNA_ORIENTATION=+
MRSLVPKGGARIERAKTTCPAKPCASSPLPSPSTPLRSDRDEKRRDETRLSPSTHLRSD